MKLNRTEICPGASCPGAIQHLCVCKTLTTVSAAGAALDGATLTALREKMAATQQRAANVLANFHLPHLPTRNEICSRAMAMFGKTSSMDDIVDIVDIAHMLILDTIGARLVPPQNQIMSAA